MSLLTLLDNCWYTAVHCITDTMNTACNYSWHRYTTRSALHRPDGSWVLFWRWVSSWVLCVYHCMLQSGQIRAFVWMCWTYLCFVLEEQQEWTICWEGPHLLAMVVYCLVFCLYSCLDIRVVRPGVIEGQWKCRLGVYFLEYSWAGGCMWRIFVWKSMHFFSPPASGRSAFPSFHRQFTQTCVAEKYSSRFMSVLAGKL